MSDSVRPHRRQPTRSPVSGILQARTLEWVAISSSNAWKWKVKVTSLSRVQLFVTPWTAAHQAPPSMGFSRQECWSGTPLPSLWRSKSALSLLVSERFLQRHITESGTCITAWNTQASFSSQICLQILPSAFFPTIIMSELVWWLNSFWLPGSLWLLWKAVSKVPQLVA